MRYAKIISASSPHVWSSNLVGEIIPIKGWNFHRFAHPDFANFTPEQLGKVKGSVKDDLVIHPDCYVECESVSYELEDLLKQLDDETKYYYY